MSIAVGHLAAGNSQGAHGKHPNFGALVSAINRGDIDGARNAFEGLVVLGPKAPGPLRKGALDAMTKALAGADIDEAKKALKDLQQAQISKPAVLPAAPNEALNTPALGSTISFMI